MKILLEPSEVPRLLDVLTGINRMGQANLEVLEQERTRLVAEVERLKEERTHLQTERIGDPQLVIDKIVPLVRELQTVVAAPTLDVPAVRMLVKVIGDWLGEEG